MKLSEIQDKFRDLRGQEFENFVVDALRNMKQFSDIQRDVLVHGRQIDIQAFEHHPLTQGPIRWYFEVKGSGRRISSQQVHEFAMLAHVMLARSPSDRFVLVTNVPLTAEARALARHSAIEIWEPQKLLEITPSAVLADYIGLTSDSVEEDSDLKRKAAALRESLHRLKPGRSDWSAYQRLVAEAFEFLFCPPLEPPRQEMSDTDRRNRRDMIFENTAKDGWWAHLRSTYAAHYIVADAKNYVSPLKKAPVLEIAHYLKPHGCGMFALVACRRGAGIAATHAIREQWIASRKMIVVLEDKHLEEMIRSKVEAGDPEELIRRAISEFRMSL